MTDNEFCVTSYRCVTYHLIVDDVEIEAKAKLNIHGPFNGTHQYRFNSTGPFNNSTGKLTLPAIERLNSTNRLDNSTSGRPASGHPNETADSVVIRS